MEVGAAADGYDLRKFRQRLNFRYCHYRQRRGVWEHLLKLGQLSSIQTGGGITDEMVCSSKFVQNLREFKPICGLKKRPKWLWCLGRRTGCRGLLAPVIVLRR